MNTKPAQAHEEAGVAPIRERLLEVDADAGLMASLRARRCHIGHRPGRRCDRDCLGVVAHARGIAVGEEAQDRAVAPRYQCQLEVLPARPRQRLERLTVGGERHPVHAVLEGPLGAHVANDEAVSVAAGVGREVPGGIVPERPVEELGARGIGVAVLVEIVRYGQQSHLELETPCRLGSRELILSARDLRHLRAERQHEAHEGDPNAELL